MTNEITNEELARLKALAEAATPGPWHDCGGATPHYGALNSTEGFIVYGYADVEKAHPLRAPSMERQIHNRKHIAASNPATILALIAKVESLAADAERYYWLADRVLACDYGDNEDEGKIGWRIRHELLGHGGRQPTFMYGNSINEAVDAGRAMAKEKA